jgi:hypothetical protein
MRSALAWSRSISASMLSDPRLRRVAQFGDARFQSASGFSKSRKVGMSASG